MLQCRPHCLSSEGIGRERERERYKEGQGQGERERQMEKKEGRQGGREMKTDLWFMDEKSNVDGAGLVCGVRGLY
jgi:hypothetical protein